MRVCAEPGCPNIYPNREGSRCRTHRAEQERRRGTPTARGYGHHHVKTREAWKPRVATGTINCARCGQPIQPGQPWHLDHDDDHRTSYRGPSHEHCNTRAGGLNAHW